jgi:hypothetical protein
MDTSNTGSAKATVYIETSIVSYLTARPSRDLLVAAHQHLTAAWWDHQRPRYELFTSQVVLTEADAGDPEAAQRRLTALEPLPLLDVTDAAIALAATLITGQALPAQAAQDALHLAIACVHGMEVPPDVELHASGECAVTESHRTGLSRGGLCPADYLYPRRT